MNSLTMSQYFTPATLKLVLLTSAILFCSCNNNNNDDDDDDSDADVAPPLNNSATMTVSSIGANSFLIRYVTKNTNSFDVNRTSGSSQWGEMKIINENSQNVKEPTVYLTVVTEYKLAPNETMTMEYRWNGSSHPGLSVIPGVYKIVCTDFFNGLAKIDGIEILPTAVAAN